MNSPKSAVAQEIDAYASSLECDASSSSPPATVRPVPLGVGTRDGNIPPDAWPEDDPYEQVLRQSVAAICSSIGFDAIDVNMLELLTRLMRKYLRSISMGTKLNYELAGRTVPTVGDVWVALADLGHKVDQLPAYLRRLRATGTIAIAPPRERHEPPAVPPMLIGQSRPHPPYVHEFFPPFPEPHTYIHTEILGEPDLSYEAVRKTAAQRRRETERSLINLMLCSHPSSTLFSHYEGKVRNEARQYLRDVEQERVLRKQQKKAMKATIGNSDTNNGAEDLLGVKDQTSSDEDLEEVAETELSLMLQRIPPSCTVVLPMPESRPYMSCLRPDDMKEKSFHDDDDEEENDKKEDDDPITLARTGSSIAGGGSGGNESEGQGQAYDNLYLRIAQLQQKEMKILREERKMSS